MSRRSQSLPPFSSEYALHRSRRSLGQRQARPTFQSLADRSVCDLVTVVPRAPLQRPCEHAAVVVAKLGAILHEAAASARSGNVERAVEGFPSSRPRSSADVTVFRSG